MKKALSLFLSLIMVMGVFISVPVTVNAASVDDLTFELNEDGTYYIVSDCDDYASGDVVIPETYDGLPVKEIGEHAFSNCGYIISVSIPKYVLKIGDCAFYECYQLERVNIPDGVEIIGQSAFKNCEKLSSVSLPDSIRSIGGAAFLYSSIYDNTSNWENGVLYIDHHLIRANYEICETYTVKDGTITIAGSAFRDCNGLTSIVVPDTVVSIGESAFYDSGLETVSLSKGVTEIKDRAFAWCGGLKEILIPDGVKSIGEEAFYYCSSLENITLPDTIENISRSTFHSTAYEQNEANWNNNVLYINNHLVATRADIIGGSYTIKKGTVTIADNAFDECVAITDVTIPESVVSIGDNAFSDCVRLKSITIPASIVSIGDYAFYNCYQLENIYIPNGVEIIGVSAFEDCEQLTSVFIPDSVTKIGGYAFFNCTNLMSIEIPATVISIGDRALGYCGYYFNSQQIMDFTINGTIGTEAEKYANENGFIFVDLNHIHTPSDWIIDKDATVNYSGWSYIKCTSCGEVLETAVIPQLKPATPKLTAIANTASGVKVTWGKVNGADSYIVYRRTYNAKTKAWGGWTRLADGVTSTSYVDKTAKSGYYRYTVKAVNEAGNSGYNTSGIKTYFLAVPKSVTTSNTTNTITVKWGKVAGATGYIVYRKTTDGWTRLGTTKGTSFADKTAKAGVTYRYTIKAYYGSYVSAYNTNGYAVRRLTIPTLKSAVSSKTGITFTWNKVTGATGYIVYRKTGSGSWQRLGTVKTNTYLDKTAKKGVTYKYTVKAYYGTSTSHYNSKGLTVKDKY